VVLSAERVAGVTSMTSSTSTTTTLTASSGGVTSTLTSNDTSDDSSTGVNLLWNAGAGNVFAIPRLAIDAFVAPQVTLGGSAGYMSRGGSTKSTSVTTTPGSRSTATSDDNDLPDVSAFVLSPRLGVVVTLGPRAALWLRGGITYFQTSLESTTIHRPTPTDNSTTTVKVSGETSGTAATFDAQLVFVPMDHVGITIGPVFDIGLGGHTKTTTTTTIASSSSSISETDTAVTDGDLTQSNYGASAGIIAFF